MFPTPAQLSLELLRIGQWYMNLPTTERDPYYKLSELVDMFKANHKPIERALRKLEWRKLGSGGYFVWVPPPFPFVPTNSPPTARRG